MMKSEFIRHKATNARVRGSNGFFNAFLIKSHIAPGLWTSEEKWVFIYILQMSGLGVSNGF